MSTRAAWEAALTRAHAASEKRTPVRVADVSVTPAGRVDIAWTALRGKPVPDDTYVDQQVWGEGWTGRVTLVETAPNRLVVDPWTPGRPAPGSTLWLEPPDFLQWILAWLAEHGDRFEGSLFARTRAGFARTAPGDALPEPPGLRAAQRDAARKAAADRSMVWGPPGTGKTYTLGAIAAGHLRLGRRVLLISNNNVAVDGLLLATDDALRGHGLTPAPGELLRTRSPVLPGLGERPHLLEWSDTAARFGREKADAQRLAAQRERAGEARADVASELREQLAALDESWREAALRLVRDARCVACTIAQYFAREGIHEQTWDAVILDEASVTPVAFALPLLLEARRLVLGGDFRQLGPVAPAELPEEDRVWLADSPFELLEVPAAVDAGRLPATLTLLDEQSRMADPICALVSRAFYGGRLRRVGAEPPPIEVPGWPTGRIVAVHRKATKTNASAELLPELAKGVERLLRAGRSVAVLTPFRAQVALLRSVLEPLRAQGPLVYGTVHRMQGQEADVAVFDTVNVHGWFLAQSDAAPRLVNVALSRARSQVVLIADREKLDRNPWFTHLPAELRWVALP